MVNDVNDLVKKARGRNLARNSIAANATLPGVVSPGDAKDYPMDTGLFGDVQISPAGNLYSGLGLSLPYFAINMQ